MWPMHGYQKLDTLVFTLASDCCTCPYISHALNSGSQYMVPATIAPVSRNLLEMHILGPTPDILDQKLYGMELSNLWCNRFLWVISAYPKLEKPFLPRGVKSVGEHSETHHYWPDWLSSHTLIANPAWQMRKTVQ